MVVRLNNRGLVIQSYACPCLVYEYIVAKSPLFIVICILQSPDNTLAVQYKTAENEASDLCRSYGGSLGTDPQLQQAYDNGFDACSCGWTSSSVCK